MPTPLTTTERTAIRIGYAALFASRSPNSHVVETIIRGLSAAGLLMTPEATEELRTLRVRVAETPIPYALTDKAATDCLGCGTPIPAGKTWCSQLCRNADDRHDDVEGDQ